MAIHPNVPGLVVTVDVDGQDLPELDDGDVDSTSTEACVVKYIEPVSGAEFGLAFRFDSTACLLEHDAVGFDIHVDGVRAKVVSYCRKDRRRHRRYISRCARRHTEEGRVRQALLFSELSIGRYVSIDHR